MADDQDTHAAQYVQPEQEDPQATPTITGDVPFAHNADQQASDDDQIDNGRAQNEDDDAKPGAVGITPVEDGANTHTQELASDDDSQKPPTPPKDEPVPGTASADGGNDTPASQPSTPQVSAPPTAPETPVTVTAATSYSTRQRTDSASTTATNATRSTTRSTRSSMVFVVTALETIAASKDARKKKPLLDSTQRALSAIRSAQGDASQLDPEVLFDPLSLATDTNTISIVTTALDCLGKLISYSYFSVPISHASDGDAPRQPQRTPLIERAIDTICDCFQGEATPPEVQMQILKSLLAAILNDKIVVHGAGLLKSVRQTYNIFLLSRGSANQQIAQGILEQMVGTVFERVKTRLAAKNLRTSSSRNSLGISAADAKEDGTETPVVEQEDSDMPVEKDRQQKMTLQTFETRKSFDDARITDAAPTTVTRAKRGSKPGASRTASGHDVPAIHVQGQDTEASSDEDEEDEIYIRDAFLVFRAMCKLSFKGLAVHETVDPKSSGMRSKLLSLHIIHTVLFNHSTVFTSPHAVIRSSTAGEPTEFTQAIKQYLCLSLSRNGASGVNRVFEVAAEIFWLMMKYLRSHLQRELEVFLKEIYFTILERRAAPAWQKIYIVQQIFGRLAQDGKALVEVYLNYDCDRQALDNEFQRLIEQVSRLASQPIQVNALQQQAYQEYAQKQSTSSALDWQHKGTLPTSLAAANMAPPAHSLDTEIFPADYGLKMHSLECLIETLRSLKEWGQQGIEQITNEIAQDGVDGRASVDDLRESIETRTPDPAMMSSVASPTIAGLEAREDSQAGTPIPDDDPAQLEKIKQHKTALNKAIKSFNYKPKRGIKLLLEGGFIESSDPQDIARFMISTKSISKKSLGEFLGEGDEENIKIMHAFVDCMDFVKMRFVDALRRFLQSFRLPGEAQKIDRLMLKFAERYTSGNPQAFANADTAYVLAYSVIMLNTDQHSAQVKKRMVPEDFIKNNRGINDNADLPEDYLRGIFEEISNNEIVLDTERATAANLGQLPGPANTGGLTSKFSEALAGRNLQQEAYMQASEEMSNKTEQLFKTLLRAQRRGAPGAAVRGKGRFLNASNFKHVGPMFEVTWMSFLTALSGCVQETQNLETIRMCMDGQKLAIRISCLFDLENPRQAFVGSLARSTNLYNLNEMKAKNVEALRCLLDVAYNEGNLLKESWRDILTCISQLDRFQLISSGVEEGAVPDVMRSQAGQQPQTNGAGARRSMQLPRRPTVKPGTPSISSFQADVAENARSAEFVNGVDRIFTGTANLSGEAIVHFVRALIQVSWQEIQSSGLSESPRTYSLQKLVEISGYNMNRVRWEWTKIWQILGQHFIDVGCHNNTHVVYFALNSLRQLSMKFMEIEELPGFQFQKDFLKPFGDILDKANQVAVKDMVLRCLIQMIQARGDMIRSGWRTMFGVFTVAAREPYESIVNLAFDNVTQVYNERFGVVITQGAFADLLVCLTEFSKNIKFQKKSLQAIETLRSSVPKMLRTPECPLSVRTAPDAKEAETSHGMPKQPTQQTQEEQYWFPVLFAFNNVLMTGEDLEVRSRALNYLFDILTKYGGDFPKEFWDTLWQQVLMPIFLVLKDGSEMRLAGKEEELSVWLSTTLIQALRNMIALFTHFFESLEYMLDRFLDLLALCICQENDTLARIGSNCLQQLILQNVKKFQPVHWDKIVGAFVDLFARTEARELFSAAATAQYPREAKLSNGANRADSPEIPAGEDGASITDAGNDLKINGASGDAANQALDVNGGGRPGTPRTDTSSSLGFSSTDGPSPLPRRQSELESFGVTQPSQQQAPVVVTAARRRYFNQIITKCVLQLLMIETVSELFNNEDVYASIPSHLLLRLMALLKKSYHFAKRFNEDRELRTRLFREGFMRQPPNLLKQESGSASVYVLILLRMYADQSDERAASRPQTEAALIPLCSDIVASYISLDEETQGRNIVTWRPVVIDVLEGYIAFPDPQFSKHVETFAPMAVGLMGREMGPELQRAVQGLWQRVCETKLGIEKAKIDGMGMPMLTPTSPRPNVFGTRRGSKVSR